MKNEVIKSGILRFLRVIIPQIPAIVASVLEFVKVLTLPEWVVPSLILVGALATTADKVLRDLGIY